MYVCVCDAGEEATQKGKSLQSSRKGRGGEAKEKSESKEIAEVGKADAEEKISTKEMASEESQKLSGRPKRGKQTIATPVANEKPATTPKRCGKSRGKAATENMAETCSSECTLEEESSPTRGAKRKREEANESVEEEKEEPVAETGSPKKSKTEETPKEEVEKMEVETVDETNKEEAETSKEEKATESVAVTEKEDASDGVACVPFEASDKGIVDESKSGEKLASEEELLISASEEPATSDVKENGTTKTNEEITIINLPLNKPESEVVSVTDATEEKASPSQNMEETLRNGTDDSPSNDALLARKFIWHKGEEPSPSSLAQTFSIVSYNILADYHAQRDFTGPNSWITKEHLSVDYRHSLLMKEFRFLDSDILCLQEVQTDYFTCTLKPALAE